jgi:acyl dehydratase
VHPRWEDLAVGTVASPREYGPLTITDFVRYQGASGDFNPIHHDEGFARAAGFPTVFSVGMLQAGTLAGFCSDWLGADNVRRFAVQFREQVWPGDHLVCEAVVAERDESGPEPTVTLDVLVRRVESGGLAVAGQATFAVP